MEDDDEFGDLYTDVISSFPTSVTPPVDVLQSNPNSNSTSFQNPETRDLNFNLGGETITGDLNLNLDEETTTRDLNLIENQEERISPSKEQNIRVDDDEDTGGALIPGLQPLPRTINNSIGSSSDSDSEDDLQIVLNDIDPTPNGIIDDGFDGHEPIVNMAGDAAAAAAEDPDWAADDAAPPDAAAAAKPPPNAPFSAPHRTNYAAYQPFHSQFKYVRPGAAPLPAPAPMAGPGPGPGRGRGDLRPPMHKGFNPNHYAPTRGLDFTLPSHKTIFDVDIDNFEEKPWKYPGVDVSDFFNFSLNAESWKDYCKQLEQLRLESTMQSKIRVYESGRAEQEYDPDLPPELAAAAAMNDSSAENTDIAKADGGLGDPAKAAALARPILPTGRAIQVETGYGERLPSVDARPPRLRDSDAVIEIVLQDCIDNDSAGNGDTAISDNDSCREDEQVDVANENGPLSKDEDFAGYPQGRDVMTEDVANKRSPLIGSPHADVHDKERGRSSPERSSSDHHSGSKDRDSTENIDLPCEDRWKKDTACERSPRMSPDGSAHDRRSLGHQREDSSESVERRRSPESFSLARVEDAVEATLEEKDDDDFAADHRIGKEKEDGDVIGSADTSKNKHRIHSTKQKKLSCRVEPSATKDVDDGEDLKASRSSDTSKATGNSRDHQKWREGIDEEVVQNGRSAYMGDVKRHRGEVGHKSRRKDFDDRTDMDRNYVSAKGREDSYYHKEWDPYTVNHFHVKPEGGDRRRERDHSEASWQRQDEDPHRRRVRAEDARKQERGDEMVSRHRRKVREIDRSDKDEYLQSHIILENVSGKRDHEKDARLRYREKDDVSRNRHEKLDDHHGNRRKDDDYMSRDHVDKQDRSFGLRESSSTRGKREREGFLNQQKRDEYPRARDIYDNHHAVRLKDEVWVQRERAEQQRDMDELYRAKQSYEENSSRRDREEGRAPIRNNRVAEEKIWAGHSHGREEYQSHDKDAGRHGEQLKRKERGEDEISLHHRGSEDVYARGNQIVSEGKRPRQEKSAARNDRAVSASDNQKFHDKKLKDNFKKARESEGHSTAGLSKRHQGGKKVANDTGDAKGLSEKDGAEHDTSLHNLSREGFLCKEEQQESKRGRSKLERWTSHKDRDHDVNSKSSSLKMKEMAKNRNAPGSSSVAGDESAKNVEAGESNQCKESGGGSEVKDVVDAKPTNHRREDTVERLKRRRERFKLELASEKDAQAMNKTENESIPSSQNETPTNSQVKQERPPRKRRWLSS